MPDGDCKTQKFDFPSPGWLIPLVALVVLVAAGMVTQKAAAQSPTPSADDVNRVASQLYCPVCENIPLDVCGTTACAQWRGLIGQKLAAGWSDDQIKQYFVAQYGERVLAVPPRQGLNWLVYILPPLFLIAGAILVYTVMRRMRKKALVNRVTPPAEQPNVPEDPYYLRLEEELKKRQ